MSYDDYSDSDDSAASDIRTSVLLGLPDGPFQSTSDLSKLRISRIGGHPVFPHGAPVPPLSVSHCKNCGQPMELLLQLWCPFESSPYDRTLHVWGCSRTKCQRKEGSVKAARIVRYNEKYAAKLEAQKARVAAKKAASQSSQPAKPAASAANPFSISSAASGTTQLFGGGFGDEEPASTTQQNDAAEDVDEDESESDPSSASEDEDEVEVLSSTLKKANLNDPSSDWSSAPAHPPLYLDTASEYIAPPSKATVPKTNTAVQDTQDNQWGVEGYERQEGIDEIFEKFVERVNNEPEQVIRYELSGTPLSFQTDSLYKALFPLASSIALAPGAHTTITGSGAITTPASSEPGKRQYAPSENKLIPSCPRCGGPRTFECQLMPNMINVFRAAKNASNKSSVKKTQTDEERRAEVAKILKGELPVSGSEDVGGETEKGDMEWGTCMVFTCLSNCSRDESGKEVKAVWAEEVVLVQWDA